MAGSHIIAMDLPREGEPQTVFYVAGEPGTGTGGWTHERAGATRYAQENAERLARTIGTKAVYREVRAIPATEPARICLGCGLVRCKC